MFTAESLGYENHFNYLILVIFAYIAYRIFWYSLACRVVLTHSDETCSIKYKNKVTDKAVEIPLHQYINITCPLLANPQKNLFQSHPFLWSGHLQTIYTGIYGEFIYQQKCKFDREYVTTLDDGVVSLDFDINNNKDSDYYVLIFHGLSGGSHNAYCQELIEAVKKYGYQSVVMNFRGCNNTPVKSPQLYAGSYTDDIDTAIAYLKKRNPRAQVFGVGFSAGANILLKYCGEQGKNCPLLGVVSIANPYDCLGCCYALKRSFLGTRFYLRKMGQNLKNAFYRHIDAFEKVEWLDLQKMEQVKSMVDYDRYHTSKNFGYKTVHEYYSKSSCSFDIPYIEIPALLLTALDDPISNQELIPYDEVMSNPHVILATTKYGGHQGYFEAGTIIPRQRWFPKPVAQYIHAIIKAHHSIADELVHKKIDPLAHTGTPFYSLPSKARSDREELKRHNSGDNSVQTGCDCDSAGNFGEANTCDCRFLPTTKMKIIIPKPKQ